MYFYVCIFDKYIFVLHYYAMKTNKSQPSISNINTFPQQDGLLLFGVSMNKIGNVQSPQLSYEHMRHLFEKITYPMVGLNFIYADSLYLYTDMPAYELKQKLQDLMHQHKYGFLNKIKNTELIPKAYNFLTWSQSILACRQWSHYQAQLRMFFQEDKQFQKYITDDIQTAKQTDNPLATDFILEEILMFYLVSKGVIKLPNEYIQGHEKWVLWCYPGKPLKSEIYLYQQDFFNLDNPQNIYQNHYYDLEAKKLYKYALVNLEATDW